MHLFPVSFDEETLVPIRRRRDVDPVCPPTRRTRATANPLDRQWKWFHRQAAGRRACPVQASWTPFAAERKGGWRSWLWSTVGAGRWSPWAALTTLEAQGHAMPCDLENGPLSKASPSRVEALRRAACQGILFAPSQQPWADGGMGGLAHLERAVAVQ